jgi:hypothetical protein
MTGKRAPLLLALIAFGIALLAACGGGSDSTPTPSGTAIPTVDPNATVTARPTRTAAGGTAAPEACALVTETDVAALIGTISAIQPTSGQCDWTGANGTLTAQLELETTVDAATQKVSAFASGAEAVSAGDAAFFSGSQIVGRKGLYVFTISTTVQASILKDSLATLARSAASALPAAP